jgi:putative transposase
MQHELPQRQRIRLSRESYSVPGAVCSATIGTNRRARIFSDTRLAGSALEVLRSLANKLNVPVYGFCFMPDHVHLVLGASTGCDIITFVAQFKNLAQRAAWQHGVHGRIWQQSFWDHFLRNEEQLENVVRYVLNNPVRAGMSLTWQDYPYCGSLVFDFPTER